MAQSKMKTTLGERPIIFTLCLESTMLVHMKVFWMKSRKANVVWQSQSGLIFICGGFRACRFFVLLSTLLAMVWSGQHGANSHSDTDLRGSLSCILYSVAMKMEAVCSSKNLGHTIIT
jgi:hypothetical protein